jgi:hypothetical protein
VAAEHLTPTLEAEPGKRVAFLSLSTLKSGKWYRLRPRPEEPTVLGALVKTLVGVVVGILAYASGAHSLAVVIWIISGIIGVVSLSSQKARSGVTKLFAALGRWLGWILGTLLLAPLFLIGFTIARVVSRLAGRDPLHLRDPESQTYWLPADQDRRTVRHVRSLYATEVPTAGGRGGVMAVAAVVGLLVAAELVARSLGFGNPILYVIDEKAGFYPAPHQQVTRYGGTIKTNSYGMRGPEFEPTKKPGTLRIFMIGDSTLYGGSFVDQADIYARRLDDLLDTKSGANDVEVLNIGVNSWGPFQEVGYVEKFGTFGSDVAIVCLPIGDIYRGMGWMSNVPYFSVDSPPRFGLEEIGRHLLWRSRAMMQKAPDTGSESEQGHRGVAKYVELAKKLQSAGCEVVFLVLPGRQAGMTTTAPESEQQAVDELRKALEPLRVPVDYPIGLFEGKGTPDGIYHDVCHLLSSGNLMYADYLKSRLPELSTKIRAHRSGASEAAAPKESATK